MPIVYLFRIDGSKDNDAYFDAISPTAAHVYAGLDFRIGNVGWIPDFVGVSLGDSHCALTLIELEATESEALRSCRKFLPENSTAIVEAFINYLERVIRQCQSTADRRANDFKHLKGILSDLQHVTVSAAGALRSSAQFIENLPLIDQPRRDAISRQTVPTAPMVNGRQFQGTMRLSANEAKAVARCVMILDAVVRGRDHSVAVFRTWRGQDRIQPLKVLLKRSPELYPALRSFIFEKGNSGLTLNFEEVLCELTEIWSTAKNRSIDGEQIRRLVATYYPVANKVTSHVAMTDVFDAARRHVSTDFADLVGP